MTPHAFIAKWRDATLKERSAAQEHFLDLCRLLDEPTPAEADPTGATYCFERGARKDTGGDGWADVWKRHCFAWEYKGQRANLDAAFAQLRQYALALENPPLLIVSDLRRFRIRTNWTNSVSRTYEFDLDDLTDHAVRDRLKWAFSDPERLRPGETRRTNADVLKPWVNGMDLTRRPAGKWIVDFGWTMSDADTALYEEPFRWVKKHVYPMRSTVRRKAHRERWWRHADPRPGMWAALGNLSRYIATPTVAKHRLFVWCDARICPDHQLIVITRDDDVTFGILHSRFHEAWSLRLCTWQGKGNDPRYTPTTTFETFPFPDGLTPNTPATDYESDPRARTITEAAKRLVELRDRWLNPPEWVDWVDEPVSGYPKRPVPRDEAAATALKTRTLTSLYNARPTWLADAHAALDAAVATAYGWPADISNDAALSELLALNLANGR